MGLVLNFLEEDHWRRLLVLKKLVHLFHSKWSKKEARWAKQKLFDVKCATWRREPPTLHVVVWTMLKLRSQRTSQSLTLKNPPLPDDMGCHVRYSVLPYLVRSSRWNMRKPMKESTWSWSLVTM
jgi:hypothetical protein